MNVHKAVLLHCCCAPCSLSCIAALRDMGIFPTLFWYNPNIHPWTEYKNRRDCLVQYAEQEGLALVVEDEYGLRKFIKALYKTEEPGMPPFIAASSAKGVDPAAFPGRCAYCYHLRMDRCAAAAKAGGFDAFCTTLFASPYQNQELLVQAAEAAALRHGVRLLYRDFRPHFYAGRNEARGRGFYMQKYCGCIFSEEERYRKTQPALPTAHSADSGLL